jgi:DNA-binding Lrp family transcriptional regulator
MAIQENPLATVTELVDRVDGSKPTVIKRLSFLREQRYFSVKALLNEHNMGFDAVDVFLDAPNLRNVEKIERMATNHPYTGYRSRCFGAHNGVYLQFRNPVGSNDLIEEVIKILKDDGIVENYRIIPVGLEPTINASMKLDAWNPNSMSWTFDWLTWFDSDVETVKPSKPKTTSGNVLDWITKNDLYILQQLMYSAKRSNTDMIREIKNSGVSFTPQTFGRRLRLVDEGCVEKYRVDFNPNAFDILSNILIHGSGKKKYLRDMFSKMSKNPIPFASTMRVTDSDLFWYVRMPSTHLSSLLSNLHHNLENMTVTLIDYPNSFLYSIWPEILDEENKVWRQDREFMIDQALK